MDHFVEFEDVCKYYQTGSVKIAAADHMNFYVDKGEFCIIVGPSGAGKTTLLNILGGMDSCDEGHVWLDGHIYIHCALEGRKIDVLRRDGRVGFSTAVDVCIIREKSTTHFRSLCGTGRVSEVTDTEEKRRALDAISLRFDARCPRPTPDAALARVNILRIDVESLTCRHKNGPRRKDKE